MIFNKLFFYSPLQGRKQKMGGREPRVSLGLKPSLDPGLLLCFPFGEMIAQSLTRLSLFDPKKTRNSLIFGA